MSIAISKFWPVDNT